MGSVDNPLNAGSFALGSGARFVARTVDTLQKHMPGVLARAHEHKGASFVEIFQNCIVYNDGVFKHFTDKSVAAEMQVHVEHGKPLVFGKDDEKGLRMKAGLAELEVVTIGENGVTEADVLIHDEANKMLAMMLTSMDPPHFPVALGVIYCNPSTNYDQAVYDQIGIARDKGDEADMNTLLRQGHTWTV